MGLVGESMELQTLKAEVMKDHIVDGVEAKQLRDLIFADKIVDRPEADALFEINDDVTGNANDKAWGDLFVEGVTSHVLGDTDSPQEVDEGEADYLIGKIFNDGKVDDIERQLLTNIKLNAKSVHPKLVAKFTELGI